MNRNYSMQRNITREPYIGMPVCLDGCMNINFDDMVGNGGNTGGNGNNSNNGNSGSNGTIGQMCACLETLPLAMAYVPMQSFGEVYGLEEGFRAGTIFPVLDLPFRGGMRR